MSAEYPKRVAIKVSARTLLQTILDVRRMEALQGRDLPREVIVEIEAHPTVATLKVSVPDQISNLRFFGDEEHPDA